MEEAIGGYFGLELPAVGGGEHYKSAYRFQSARAAFLSLLLSGMPSRVWVPWYMCDSMIEPMTMAGIPMSRYKIDNRLDIAEDIPLGENEWLLYVNYFGVCDRNTDSVLSRFPSARVIIDNSQAFFSPPKNCLATIYSARKFFGVPNGGYLMTARSITEPNEEDDGVMTHCVHLLKRLAVSPEAGYADYNAAEESLKWQRPKRMSQLTGRLLSSIDYAAVRARRRDNARMLHEQLAHLNLFRVELDPDAAPLCYPFLGAAKGVRECLIRQRIFIPCYWPEVAINSNAGDIERRFAQACLPLPCDQRMERGNVNRLLTSLLEAMA